MMNPFQFGRGVQVGPFSWRRIWISNGDEDRALPRVEMSARDVERQDVGDKVGVFAKRLETRFNVRDFARLEAITAIDK
jgi:hypothetical protein